MSAKNKNRILLLYIQHLPHKENHLRCFCYLEQPTVHDKFFGMSTLEERQRPPGPESRSTNLKRLNKFHFLVVNVFYEGMISSEMQFKMGECAIYILLRAVISNECKKLIVFRCSDKT